MRALSLWQPWAAAMHIGVKQNETRGWGTPYRGDIAIHAAKHKMTQEDWDLFYEHIEPEAGDGAYTVHFGCVLCVVELWDCVPTETIKYTPEFVLGNYGPARFAWRTRNLRPLKEPVPILGRQGLWVLNPEEVKAIRAKL